MGRWAIAVAVWAVALLGSTAGPVLAVEPRAEVQGELEGSLSTSIATAVGVTDKPIQNRFEARRRAREAAEDAIAVLRSEGYYAYEVEPDVGEGDAPKALVRVKAGARFKFFDPKVEWVGTAPDRPVAEAGVAAMGIAVGAPGRAAEVVAAEGRIVSTVQKRGYADAQAAPREVVVDHADATVRPTFRIEAGALVRLNGIEVVNPGRTRRAWIDRLATWRPGDPYDPEDVAELERRLLDTGVYDSVTVALAPKEKTTTEGYRPVVVSLADRSPRSIELGASYATSEGFGLDGRWTRYNSLGRFDTLAVIGRLSNVDSRLSAELTLPHWRQPQQTLKLTGAGYSTNTDAYNETGAGVRADVQRRFGKTSYINAGASLDVSRTEEKQAAVLTPLGREVIVAAVFAGFSLDRSNDPLDPSHGWRAQMLTEPTLIAGDDTLPYLKIQGQVSGYFPFGETAQTVLAGRLKLGSIIGGQVDDVPASRRFYAGGGGSVRGFSYQAVGPRLLDNTPQGGLSLLEASFEVRHKLTRRWGAVAFLDVGAVGTDQFPTGDDLSAGAGVGIRYDLGFGPIRADIAVPLDKRKGDPAFQIYLSIGQSFSSETADTPPPQAAPARRNRLPKAIIIACAILALLIIGVGLTARYGVLLPQTRLLLEARTDGLKLGRYGRLKIEGLGGDIWRDFTMRRLTIRDEKGVWLDARNLHLEWRYEALFRRRFEATRLTAETVQVVRRPTLTPKGKSGGLPVAIDIKALQARVELLPAFSYRRGVYDVTGALDVARGEGGQSVRLTALSQLHAGDRLAARVEMGGVRPLNIMIDALEARGGAMAGALGLPANQTFALSVRASGKASQGQFTAKAVSGQTTPLDAKGAWNGQGGDAAGRLSLTASRLTQGLAKRVGPDAVFAIAGRRAQSGLFALDGRVVARNLTVIAVGQGDIGKRTIGPQGLAVTAQTPRLGDLAGGPSKGPAVVKGLLKGSQADLRFAGEASLSRLEAGGYSLSRVSGPVQLSRTKDELSLRARLVGADGRGSGFVAALLGKAPRADLEGSRLADGRLLLKDLQATGAGLKVKASGGRNLLGGLTFKGDAAFSNLAAARKGASGLMTAAWSANQGGAGKPWVLTLDAKGARFASGFAELDRLLGASPQLRAAAEVAGGRVAVSNAKLSGAKIQAAAAGVRESTGVMAFKLDWSAEGPFRAGPVEMTGAVKGSGAVAGTLAEPRADLVADIDQVELPRLLLKAAHVTLTFARRPDGSSGAIALTAASEYGPAAARSDFRFPEGGVDLSGLSLDAGGVKASGSLSLRRRAPSAADLDLVVTQGALIDAGRLAGTVRITDAAGGPQAKLDLTAENVDPKGVNLAIRRGRLTAAGPMSRLPYDLEASGVSRGGRWTVGGRGTFVDRDGAYALAFEGDGKLGKRDLRTTEPAVFGFGGGARTAKLRLAASDGGRISLDGRLNDKETEVRASLQKIGLGLLNEDLTGEIDANLALAGQGGRLDGTLDAKLEGARGRGTDAATGVDGQVKARLAGDTLTIDAETTNRQGLKANASLVLPAEASASPFRVALHRQRPMRGRFFADGEVKPLWDLLVGGERSLAGQVHAEGTLAGSLGDPQALGQVSLAGGRFEDGPTGLILREVTLRAQFVNASINVTEGQGQDGHGGTVNGSGRINLTRNGVSSFRMDLKDFRLIDNSQATASATGPATIDRDAQGRVRITGNLVINEAQVAADPPTPSGVVAMEVVERNKPDDAGSFLQAAPRTGPGVALDVTLKAPRRVFLRGRGLDLELSLDAHVGGATSRPILTGVARVVRGDYDFAGKRFEFDDRGVVTLATSPQNIRLNLTAVREDPSLTAAVRITGTAAKPEITLTSSPVLPSDEILSQVLFGRSAAQLSPLEAAQLASALSALAGGGGLDVIGNLKTFAGLDRLALGGGGESGVTVAGGKYLTDDVYLELIGGGRDGTAAQVEWRVRRNLSIISKIAGQGDAKLAVRWRRDY